MQRSKLVALGLASVLWVGIEQTALAQSSIPFGFWTTTSGETLLVTVNGECSQGLNGSITVAGRCTWNGSYRGGILTIYASGLPNLAPVYFNVVWVNQNTITVWGDVFTRQQ
jgi:hypothetical protein